MKELFRSKVRPIAMTLVAPVMGLLLLLILEVSLKFEVSGYDRHKKSLDPRILSREPGNRVGDNSE